MVPGPCTNGIVLQCRHDSTSYVTEPPAAPTFHAKLEDRQAACKRKRQWSLKFAQYHDVADFNAGQHCGFLPTMAVKVFPAKGSQQITSDKHIMHYDLLWLLLQCGDCHSPRFGYDEDASPQGPSWSAFNMRPASQILLQSLTLVIYQ